ncbi:MAG: hypothetical protein BGO14_07300 [Chlamydiales bacterium 38-26]|nr:hypothetical protein [Chlamydiales bacterium]OJV10810.1 MAG: hypothetical protein BGO14_07300 [Chlamydiales bacterium 38-26]
MQPVNICSNETNMLNNTLNPFDGWIFPRISLQDFNFATAYPPTNRSMRDALIHEVSLAILLVEKSLEEMKELPSGKGEQQKLYETIKYRLEKVVEGIRSSKNKKRSNEIKAEVIFILSRLTSKHLNELGISHFQSNLFLEAKFQKLQAKIKTLSNAIKITDLIMDQELLNNAPQLTIVEGVLKEVHEVLKSGDCCVLKMSENKPLIQTMSIVNLMIEEFDQSEQSFDAEKWYYIAESLKEKFLKKYNNALDLFEPLAISYLSKKTKL